MPVLTTWEARVARTTSDCRLVAAHVPRYLCHVLRFARPAGLVLAALALAATLTLGAGANPDQKQTRVVYVTTPCVRSNFTCPPFARAVRRTGVSGRIVSPDPREDPVTALSLLARQGYDLVIVDFNWTEHLGKVAPRHPRTAFAIIDIPHSWIPGRPRNVAALLIRTHEASFLAGWLGARLESRRPGRDVVGAVGGFSIPQVNDFVVGFAAGARRGSPGVTVLKDYTRDFADATKCGSAARKQIARGAGVVFNVAGACGLGTLEAAREAGVWGVGVDTDQSFLGPHVLTSVLKSFDPVFLSVIRDARAGRVATGRTTHFSVRHGAAGLGRISPKVPAPLRAELERLEARIAAGEIRVPRARYG